MIQLTQNQVYKLAVATGYNHRTVIRWASGVAVNASTRINLEAAHKAVQLEEGQRDTTPQAQA
uniref:Uncharacterized protein n=1 Tax=viral metagenome TaxID=1070528 RepID=A0A6H1ZZX8_9ZZZZ